MAEGLSGSLAQLPLRDLLRMLTGAEQTGRIEFSNGQQRAELFVQSGAPVHATADAATGDAAFAAIVAWTQGTFRFETGVESPERTITKPFEQVVAEGARAAAEREALRQAIPSADAVPALEPAVARETITVSSADWQVIATIDGERSVGRLARDLGRSDLEMVRTLYRLKQAGLIAIRIESPSAAPATMADPAFFAVLHPAVAAAMGPLAEIIIDDVLEAMDYTRTTLPRNATAIVTERIAQEIRDPAKRVRFQQAMLHALRVQAA